jgi:hypothetical protein
MFESRYISVDIVGGEMESCCPGNAGWRKFYSCHHSRNLSQTKTLKDDLTSEINGSEKEDLGAQLLLYW